MTPPSHRAPDMGDLETLQRHLEKQIVSLENTMRAAYPARPELLELLERLGERITCLEISKATLDGKADQKQVTAVLIIALLGVIQATFGLVLSIVGVALTIYSLLAGS